MRRPRNESAMEATLPLLGPTRAVLDAIDRLHATHAAPGVDQAAVRAELIEVARYVDALLAGLDNTRRGT